MTGVLPYVPTEALRFLPRDVQEFEPPVALDGGPGGMAIVSRAIRRSRRWVRRDGWLLLEIGGDQVAEGREAFAASGYRDVDLLEDGDGDVRGIYGCRAA
jgi:release factor glutamine methyltransferase